MTQPFPPSGQASPVVVVLQSYAAGTWMANRLAAPAAVAAARKTAKDAGFRLFAKTTFYRSAKLRI